MSRSKMATGKPIVTQAFGTSTIAAMCDSIGAAESSKCACSRVYPNRFRYALECQKSIISANVSEQFESFSKERVSLGPWRSSHAIEGGLFVGDGRVHRVLLAVSVHVYRQALEDDLV